MAAWEGPQLLLAKVKNASGRIGIFVLLKTKIAFFFTFQTLTPSAVKHVYDAGVSVVLPEKDKEGRRIMVFRPGQ